MALTASHRARLRSHRGRAERLAAERDPDIVDAYVNGGADSYEIAEAVGLSRQRVIEIVRSAGAGEAIRRGRPPLARPTSTA